MRFQSFRPPSVRNLISYAHMQVSFNAQERTLCEPSTLTLSTGWKLVGVAPPDSYSQLRIPPLPPLTPGLAPQVCSCRPTTNVSPHLLHPPSPRPRCEGPRPLGTHIQPAGECTAAEHVPHADFPLSRSPTTSASSTVTVFSMHITVSGSWTHRMLVVDIQRFGRAREISLTMAGESPTLGSVVHAAVVDDVIDPRSLSIPLNTIWRSARSRSRAP